MTDQPDNTHRLYRVRVTVEYLAWAESPMKAEDDWLTEAIYDATPSDMTCITASPVQPGEPLPYGWDDEREVYADEEGLTVAAALARITTQEIAP